MNKTTHLFILDKDISYLSNFKTKAFAKYFFEINSLDDLEYLGEIYAFSKAHNLPILFIGGGTNLLFGFEVYPGIIIKNNLYGFDYDPKTQILEVSSNENISLIAQKLEDQYNQPRRHRFIGLPGSVGGAVHGNAGCFGLETQNNFISAYVYDLQTGQFLTINKQESNFSYRNSVYKETGRYFIISSKFDLSFLEEKYASDADNIKFRNEVQPKGNSCGSFFKNPSRDYPAGMLIEGVGMKGYHYNNAFFSDKHANFLMTQEIGGDYRDLLHLIDKAQTKVKEKYGVELIPEVRIIKI